METTPEFRERIIEVLELIATPEFQLEYQERAPFVDVAAELFNQWEDWYHPSDACFLAQFRPVELAALEVFARVLGEVADATPAQLPPLGEFIKTKHWKRLVLGAGVALRALNSRCLGRG